MLPASLSPKLLLERAGRPEAEYVSYAHEYFPGLVHAVRVTHQNARSMWAELRAQFDNSGYWPLVVSYITNGPPGPWKEMVVSEAKDYFSRFYFKEEVEAKLPAMRSIEPTKIIQASKSANPHMGIADYRARMSDDDPVQDTDWIRDFLQRTYGETPDPDELLGRIPKSERITWTTVERAAFDWLMSRRPTMLNTHDPFWYEPIDPLAILLLPIAKPSHSLAYIHWWGCHTIGTPNVINLLDEWDKVYGAELMCHYGTVLHLNVSRPVDSAREAFDIASDMETICMHHNSIESAAQIVGATHWHMHNRP